MELQLKFNYSVYEAYFSIIFEAYEKLIHVSVSIFIHLKNRTKISVSITFFGLGKKCSSSDLNWERWRALENISFNITTFNFEQTKGNDA